MTCCQHHKILKRYVLATVRSVKKEFVANAFHATGRCQWPSLDFSDAFAPEHMASGMKLALKETVGQETVASNHSHSGQVAASKMLNREVRAAIGFPQVTKLKIETVES